MMPESCQNPNGEGSESDAGRQPGISLLNFTSVSSSDSCSQRQPWAAAWRWYMRQRSIANSAASSPPVPARTCQAHVALWTAYDRLFKARVLVGMCKSKHLSRNPKMSCGHPPGITRAE